MQLSINSLNEWSNLIELFFDKPFPVIIYLKCMLTVESVSSLCLDLLFYLPTGKVLNITQCVSFEDKDGNIISDTDLIQYFKQYLQNEQ